MSTPATKPAVSSPAAPAGWRSIFLVAEREVMTRLRQRVFLISTAVLVSAVVLGILAAHFLGGETHVMQLATTDSSFAQELEATTHAMGIESNVTVVADRSAGEAQLSSGDIEALIIPGSDGNLTAVVESTLDSTLQPALHGLAQQLALSDQVTSLGGDPTTVAAAVASANVTVDALNPPVERDIGQMVVGMLIGILLFVSINICGQMVAGGVVEEKTSRVVELLLSTVKPSQLMSGKVLGIGAIGLLQVILVGGAAAITATATGVLSGMGLNLGISLLWGLIWFIIGFATFATVLAALGALVSRQEEVGSATMPAIMLMIVPYIIGINVLPNDPTSPLATTLSYVPGMAPFLMPIREALGVASLPEQLLALAISIATIPVLVWFAGRIYGNAVLRTGARIKLADALKTT
ncbi:MAG: ABC transporter permease [Promicromonosporaceae bacterium]|nr:ABC transporter permease [Promicromonosporaceae bacterium]